MNINSVPMILLFIFTLTTFTGSRAENSNTADAKRREGVRRALVWLAKTMDDKAWDKIGVAGYKEVGEGRVATLTTAWLLEANDGFSEIDETMRRRIRNRADRLCFLEEAPDADGGSNWFQRFAALYASERSLREGKVLSLPKTPSVDCQ